MGYKAASKWAEILRDEFGLISTVGKDGPSAWWHIDIFQTRDDVPFRMMKRFNSAQSASNWCRKQRQEQEIKRVENWLGVA